jgi:hypothetical protein
LYNRKDEKAFEGIMKKILFSVLFVFMAVSGAWAELASTSYVEEFSATKVDTSADATQTMAGTYTVTGSFEVPTQPLPASVALEN